MKFKIFKKQNILISIRKCEKFRLHFKRKKARLQCIEVYTLEISLFPPCLYVTRP